MSTTVDERVVSMQFDNRNFEQNVKTSMSTLEKLKQSLNLNGAAKSLDGVSAAAQKVNLSPLSNGVETVRAKFSALDVMAVTALANITNSAVNAGKKIASALTIDPIKTGFQEYETQINATQTILANTASKGSDINDVNKALEELNTYADKTIYNFTEMTRNIGTFTAAGIDLDTSVNAIQGIANLAAVSGSNSQQASTAMYQLSQALAAGRVALMDWNSVVNAGMGGEMFQKALRETSEALGTGAEAAIKANGSFRESLKNGWLTSEVLTETLKKFTSTGAIEMVSEYTGMSKEAISATLKSAEAQYGEADAIEHAAEAIAKKTGKNKEEIKSTLEFAQNAENAATKVKTFTQLWDVLKESAQSGWTQTWKLLIGDFEEAKSLLTPLAEFLTGAINKMSELRNAILEKALNNPFTGLIDQVSTMTSKVSKAVDTVKDYNKVVDKIINGDFGTGQDRWNKLTEAGYDWAHAQNLVNERLGDGTRHATNYTEAQNGVSKAQKKSLDQLAKMSDKQLKSAGYTKEQIAALRELETQADKVGMSIDDFVKNVDKLDGRTLLINSFKNAGKALVTVVKTIGQAWREAFHGDASDEEILAKRSEKLYNLIAAIHKFSTYLKVNDETADKLKRTFKGLFALLDIITTIFGGGLKAGLKIVCKLLGMADVDILSMTASLGDMIVKFRDWLFENNMIVKGLKKLTSGTDGVIGKIKGLIDAFLELPIVQKAINEIKKFFTQASDLGGWTIAGLLDGLRDGVGTVGDVVIEIGKKIIEAIKNVLGIHSPSRVMFAIGGFIILGLIAGINGKIPAIIDLLKTIGSKIKDSFSDFDLGKLMALGIAAGLVVTLVKIGNALEALTSPLEGFGDVLEGASNVLNSTSKVLKSFSMQVKAKALQTIAISLAILVGAIALLTFLDVKKVWASIGALAVLALIVGGLTVVIGKFGPEQAGELGKFSLAVLGISASLLVMAIALKKLESIKAENIGTVIKGLGAIVGGLAAIIIAYGMFVHGDSARNIAKAGIMLLMLSGSLLLMTRVMKTLSGMKEGALDNGLFCLLKFAGVIAVFMLATRVAGSQMTKVAGTLIGMSVAMLLMIGVMKLIGKLDPHELLTGGIAILAFGGVIVGLVALTKLAGNNLNKLASTLLAMSVAMLLMVGVMKLVGLLEPEEIGKGLVAIVIFGGIITGLIAATRLAKNDMPKLAGTLLAMSVAIGILAGVAIVLGLISLPALAKGVGAVILLGAVMTAMIWATRGASDCKGNLIVMTVAIGVMAAAVAALSMIDGTKLAGATAAIGVLMGIFTGLIFVAGKAQGSIGPLIVLTVAIGVLAGALYILSSLPVESALGASAALSILLLSFAGSLAIISKMGPMATTGLIAMGVMTLIVAALSGIIYLLAKLPIESTIAITASLSILLLSLSGVCLILSAVGATGPAAFIGIGALLTLIAAIGGLMVGIGALAEHYPQMEEFLNTGLVLLQKIGYGLGAFFGNIIGGFAAGVTAGLPDMANNLSTFMTNLQPFIEGAKTIDPSMMDGVNALAKTILILTATDIIQGLTSFITGGSSIADFADQLAPLGKGLKSFSTEVTGIDPAAVQSAATAAKTLAEMTATIPNTGGVAAWFAGENSISKFGEELPALGKGLKGFSDSVAGVDAEAIKSAASAAKALAEMTTTIPNEGGMVSWFTGENSISKFGEDLPALGEGLKGFSDKVNGLNPELVKMAVDAAKSITDLTGSIPNEGGVAGWFAGENSISKFGEELPALGEGLKGFSDAVNGMNATNVTAAAGAAKTIAAMTDTIPNSGGVASWFAGDNSITNFADELPKLGKGLKGFSDSVDGISPTNVTAAANAGKTLADMAKTAPADTSKLQSFGNNLVIFGQKLRLYFSKTSGLTTKAIQTTSNAMNTINKSVSGMDTSKMAKAGDALEDLGKSLKSVSTISATTSLGFVKALNGVAKAGITTLLKAFKDSDTKMDTAGKEMINNVVGGAEKQVKKAKSTFTKIASSCVSAIGKSYSDFYDAGEYLVKGFAAGITRQTYMAEARARAMANAAERAAKKALDEHSPSKVFYKIGAFAGQGFVNAFSDYESKSFKAGSEVAKSATTGLSNAIAKVKDIVDGNIDAQPTIRPVLDLSDVSAGARTLSGMFNMNPSVGVMSNIRAVNSMRGRGQNGANDDVVSAIRDLKDSINNASGDTYSINGITYDDGSNIASAVQDIVRAARVERRA